jgi:hypothetical protein
MNQLQQLILSSKLADQVKDDLVLLVTELNQVEQLRIKKAVELQAFGLLKLLPIKYKSKIESLRASQGVEVHSENSEEHGIDLSVVEVVKSSESPDIVDEHSEPEYADTKTQHAQFTFDEFNWSKLVSQIEQLRPNDIAVNSILKQANYLGRPISHIPVNSKAIPTLKSIESIKDPRQLGQLDSVHVSFLLDENPDQKLLLFKEKLLEVIGSKKTISEIRGYFMFFLKSPLFFKYTFTGLTALNLKTDVPRKTLLNILHQNDERFLNLSQFEWCAKLVRAVRSVATI